MKKEEIYQEILKEFGVKNGDIVDICDDFFMFPYHGKGKVVGCDVKSIEKIYKTVLIVERLEAINYENNTMLCSSGFLLPAIEDYDYLSEANEYTNNTIFGYSSLEDIKKIKGDDEKLILKK